MCRITTITVFSHIGPGGIILLIVFHSKVAVHKTKDHSSTNMNVRVLFNIQGRA